MAREAGRVTSSAVLALLGLLIALPMLLIASTMMLLENRLSADPADAAVPIASPEYARSFAISVFEPNRTIRLWMEDFDGQPSFRQTVEVDGQPISDQIYIAEQRTLYTGEGGTGAGLTWSRVDDVGPEELQLTALAAGPGAWALEYGVGDHQVPADGGTLAITVHSVEEDLPADVFELPPDAEPAPAE